MGKIQQDKERERWGRFAILNGISLNEMLTLEQRLSRGRVGLGDIWRTFQVKGTMRSKALVCVCVWNVEGDQCRGSRVIKKESHKT